MREYEKKNVQSETTRKVLLCADTVDIIIAGIALTLNAALMSI